MDAITPLRNTVDKERVFWYGFLIVSCSFIGLLWSDLEYHWLPDSIRKTIASIASPGSINNSVNNNLEAKSVENYFFVGNEVIITECLPTAIDGEDKIRLGQENQYEVPCDSSTDSLGTVLVTCEKVFINLIYVTKDKYTCNTLRESTRIILGL